MADTQKMQFKAEIRELLSLMIHSIYSNREIFIRELTANAADAIDKARFEALTKPELVREWLIRIEANKDAGTLSFADNGIGMTSDELIENLGTIAHSGTKAFAEALKNAKEANTPELIGQFGVGFYSAFMAADKVTVNTRKADSDKAYQWDLRRHGGIFRHRNRKSRTRHGNNPPPQRRIQGVSRLLESLRHSKKILRLH